MQGRPPNGCRSRRAGLRRRERNSLDHRQKGRDRSFPLFCGWPSFCCANDLLTQILTVPKRLPCRNLELRYIRLLCSSPLRTNVRFREVRRRLSKPFVASDQNTRRWQIRTADQDVESFQRGKLNGRRIVVEKTAQTAESPASDTVRKLHDR